MPARTATVTNICALPGSPLKAITKGPVSAKLNTISFTIDGTTEKARSRYADVDPVTGSWSMVLEINDDLDPTGTSWVIREPTGATWTIQLAAANAGQTVNLRDVLVADPTNPNPIVAGATVAALAAETSARTAGDAATLASAATDATTKANSAQAAATVAAATDATTKAGAAQAAAQGSSLQKTANLGDLASPSAARTALGLGSMAVAQTSDYLPAAAAGEAGGVATLDGGATVPTVQLPLSVLDGRWLKFAPAPTGNRTTDSANVQALVDTAQSTGAWIVLQPGTYKADITTTKGLTQPKILGCGQKLTAVDGYWLVKGTSGSFSGGYFADFQFVGTRATALEIQGACSVRWDRLGFFGTFTNGLLFHNYAAGDFTEMCAGSADFGTNCTTPIEYRVTSGNASFHGSGLTEGSTMNQATGATAPLVKIGAGAHPYNAPLSVRMWARATTALVLHSGDATSNFYGHLSIELFSPTTTVTVVDNASVATLPFSGSVNATAEGISLGKLVLAQQVTVSSGAVTVNNAGVPQGGAATSFLLKSSSTDYDTEWTPAIRTNYASNPSLESAQTNWAAYTTGAAPTVARANDWASRGTWSFKVTTTDNTVTQGAVYLEPRSDLVQGETWTIAADVMSSVDVTINFSGRIGKSGSPGITEGLGAIPFALKAGVMRRLVTTFTMPAPNSGGTLTNVGFQVIPTVATIPAIGAVFHVDGATIERGTVTSGSYFNGDLSNSEWLGTGNASPSVYYPALPPGLRGVYLGTASGATRTLPANRPLHKITMDQDCTFTFEAPQSAGHTFRLYLLGSFNPTFPGSVVWVSGQTPNYASGALYEFVTVDQGSTWLGKLISEPPQDPVLVPLAGLAAFGAGAWPTANKAVFMRLPVIRRASKYRYLNYRVDASSGNIQVGVVKLDPATPANFTKVMDSGLFATPAANSNYRRDLGPTLLTPGEYALFMWADNITFTTRIATNTGVQAARVCGTLASLTTGVGTSGTLGWDTQMLSSVTLEADLA